MDGLAQLEHLLILNILKQVFPIIDQAFFMTYITRMLTLILICVQDDDVSIKKLSCQYYADIGGFVHISHDNLLFGYERDYLHFYAPFQIPFCRYL